MAVVKVGQGAPGRQHHTPPGLGRIAAELAALERLHAAAGLEAAAQLASAIDALRWVLGETKILPSRLFVGD